MQKMFKLASVAALCATAAAVAHADVAFDANLELDTTYRNEANATKTNTARASDLSMDGRVELNAGARATNGQNFVAGRASLLLNKKGETAVDDFWVQAGNASADLKLGRFEAMDLFPVAKDTVLEEANATYKGSTLRGRMGKDTFHAALGLNAAQGLRVELGLVSSKDAGEAKGFRPAVSYTSGPLTLRAGAESIKIAGSSAKAETGIALSAGYQVSKDAYVNVNYAKKEDDKTFGLNATIGDAGIGLVSGKGATDDTKSTTVYVAYSMSLLGVKGATVTPALSYSKGGAGQDNRTAARVRINYAF